MFHIHRRDFTIVVHGLDMTVSWCRCGACNAPGFWQRDGQQLTPQELLDDEVERAHGDGYSKAQMEALQRFASR